MQLLRELRKAGAKSKNSSLTHEARGRTATPTVEARPGLAWPRYGRRSVGVLTLGETSSESQRGESIKNLLQFHDGKMEQ
jgi:hypothetical protein